MSAIREGAAATALWFYVVIILFVTGCAVALGGAWFNLWLMPWQIKQQTAIIHNSNSYVNSHQEMIDQFIRSYYDAKTVNQKSADLNQICTQANHISSFLQGYDRTFVTTHCGEH